MYFYNTQEDALEAAKEAYAYTYHILGTVDELTDVPDLLHSLMAKSEHIMFRKREPGIYVGSETSDEDFIALNALLRQPLFEIRTISLEEARTIAHEPFEAM